MNLKHKSDRELLAELKTLRTREKELVANILHYLVEVDSRQLYLERGFSSLHAFCMEYLGYSKDEAFIRIQAVRLMRVVPETEAKIRDGSLTLTAAAKVQSAFRKEDQRRREEKQPTLSRQEKTTVLAALETRSSRDAERTLVSFFPDIRFQTEKIQPINARETLYQFTADEDLHEKLEKLKALLAHKNFDGNLKNLITILADMALKKLDPEQKAQRMQTKRHSQRLWQGQKTQREQSIRQEPSACWQKSEAQGATGPERAHKTQRENETWAASKIGGMEKSKSPRLSPPITATETPVTAGRGAPRNTAA